MKLVTLGKEIGSPSKEPIFVGDVYYNSILKEEDAEYLRPGYVTFREGARTKWHHHGCEQLLIIVSGYGIVADEEQELQVRTGDAVLIPKGVTHWHGSAPGSEMTHISILTPGEEIIHE